MNLIKKHCLAIVAGTSLLTLVACGDKGQTGTPPMTVSVVTTKTQPARLFTTLPGRVNAIEDAQVLARVTGNIETVDFEQGASVKAGQLLFTIDPKPYQAEYNQALANLKQAQATASSANALAKRYKNLVASKAISQQDYDNAVSSASQANAAIDQARAALDTAKINLGYTKVESPIDGIVGRALVTVGALVSETSGTELALVQQLDKVYVDFNQTALELSKLRQQLKEGKIKSLGKDKAEVELVLEDGSVYPQKGELLFTGVTVTPTTGQVQLRAVFPNADHVLLPGMYVQVRLSKAGINDAIMIPNAAIQRTADGLTKVMTVDKDNVIHDQPVTLGQEENGQTLVTSGLTAGVKVMTAGFSKVRAGQKVNPQEPPATGAESATQATGQVKSSQPQKSDQKQ